MTKLYLTRQQATILGQDLIEYSRMTDSSERLLFKGFELSFGDMQARVLQPDDGLEVTPIPEFIEISKDSDIQPRGIT